MTLKEALVFVLSLPPDCDTCREKREQAAHVYGDDVAVTLTLCGAHLAQYNEAWEIGHGR